MPLRLRRTTSPGGPLSPMNDLPAGATFGSLVHGVLEHADPQAADLLGELRTHVAEQLRWWPVDASVDDLAEALVPMQQTSLGPLANGLRLVDIPVTDRLCELDFEFPLVGGDRIDTALGDTHLRGVADVAAPPPPGRRPDARLRRPARVARAGRPGLRGYLSGSIDVVLRVPDPDAGQRYVVVDYKTNMLGDPDRPLTALDYTQSLMTDAMLHSHYPLQALLYSVVLHRFLRWRVPDYEPERHLGGILYLYVRGMCGPETPEIDGHPCGVFAWHPPAAMVVELSELMAGAGEGGGVVIDDPNDRRLALQATGPLAEFNRADVLSAADVHVATRMGSLLGVESDDVRLAVALAVRAVRNGSVCVDLATVAELPARRRRHAPMARSSRLGRSGRGERVRQRVGPSSARGPALPRPLLARGGRRLRRPSRAAGPGGTAARRGRPGRGPRPSLPR